MSRQCGIPGCSFEVKDEKHFCEYCLRPICKNHRDKKGGMFSKKYFCVPKCDATIAFERGGTSGSGVGNPAQRQEIDQFFTMSAPPAPQGSGRDSKTSTPTAMGSPASSNGAMGFSTTTTSSANAFPMDSYHSQGGSSPSPPSRGYPYPSAASNGGAIQVGTVVSNGYSSPTGQTGYVGGGGGGGSSFSGVMYATPVRSGEQQLQTPMSNSSFGSNSRTSERTPATASGSGGVGGGSGRGRVSPAAQLALTDSSSGQYESTQMHRTTASSSAQPESGSGRRPHSSSTSGSSAQGVNVSAGAWKPFPAVAPPTERNTRFVKLGLNDGRTAPNPDAPPIEVDCSPLVYARLNISSTGLAELPDDRGALVRGIVLGELPTGAVVWHQRGRDHPCIIPTERVPLLLSFRCARCKHCGTVIPLDESNSHVASHSTKTLVDNSGVGTCCGDVELLVSLIRKRRLGEGAQGCVWLCDRAREREEIPDGKNSGKQYVLKEIRCASEKEAQSRYQQSVRFMSLRHDHLISYFAVQLQPNKTTVCVVMPYYTDRDLSYLIRTTKNRFQEDYVGSITLQIAGALKYLHSHKPSPIIHGDIKPDNILLFNQRNQVLLMDLDTSVELIGQIESAQGKMMETGTAEWMAPETLHERKATPASDIWSLGLLVYVMTVLPDFPMITNSTGEEQLLNAKEWQERPTTNEADGLPMKVQNALLTHGYSSGLARLTSVMLHHDPSKRPTAAQVETYLVDHLTSQLTGGGGKA